MDDSLVLSHPTGNANVRQALIAFAEHRLLAEFWTTVAWNPQNRLIRLIPSGWRRQLSRRAFPARVLELTRTSPWRELARHALARTPLRRLSYPGGAFSPNAIHESLDRAVAGRVRAMSGSVRGVYAYDHAALNTFREARARGMKCFYDLPVPYWGGLKRLCDEEVELNPEWRLTHPFRSATAQELERKDEELRLADVVIVASQFSKKSLSEAPAFHAPVAVIPYGAPAVGAGAAREGRRGRPLKVLFVGGLDVRKGLPYLLKAMRLLARGAELTIVGWPPNGQLSTELEATLRTHRWIRSLAHEELLGEMARQDVLVLPTLYDGFALAITEALSQGLPVIATPNAGAAELLEHGRDGFIVPIRSADAIAEKLQLLAGDGELLASMSAFASRKAQSLSWQSYRQRLAHTVAAALEPH
jgi:glycosyltransferase involved in cell wall biosynthesis